MIEIKTVVTENYDNENRETSKLFALSRIFRTHRDSAARFKTNNFKVDCTCTSLKLSIETMLEENKPVVMERHEFEYRDESILKALFGTFGLF